MIHQYGGLTDSSDQVVTCVATERNSMGNWTQQRGMPRAHTHDVWDLTWMVIVERWCMDPWGWPLPDPSSVAA